MYRLRMSKDQIELIIQACEYMAVYGETKAEGDMWDVSIEKIEELEELILWLLQKIK